MQRAFIRSIGRESDVQIVTATGLKQVADLGHGCTAFRQICPWNVRLMTSCCCSRVRRTKLTA